MKPRNVRNNFKSKNRASEASQLSQFIWGSVFLLGGALTVTTLLITNSNLSSPHAMEILRFGCTAGMLILVAGAIGMGVFKKSQNKSNANNT